MEIDVDVYCIILRLSIFSVPRDRRISWVSCVNKCQTAALVASFSESLSANRYELVTT